MADAGATGRQPDLQLERRHPLFLAALLGVVLWLLRVGLGASVSRRRPCRKLDDV